MAHYRKPASSRIGFTFTYPLRAMWHIRPRISALSLLILSYVIKKIDHGLTFYVYASCSYIVSNIIYARKTHVKITRQWKSNLTSVCLAERNSRETRGTSEERLWNAGYFSARNTGLARCLINACYASYIPCFDHPFTKTFFQPEINVIINPFFTSSHMSRNARREGATLLHDWLHIVSSPIKVHQITQNSFTYKGI